MIQQHTAAAAHFLCRGIFQRNLGLRGWWVDWVRDIVLNMHGQDLTALKNAMDDGGDAHNIHKLIYNDILVSLDVAAALFYNVNLKQCILCISTASDAETWLQFYL